VAACSAGVATEEAVSRPPRFATARRSDRRTGRAVPADRLANARAARDHSHRVAPSFTAPRDPDVPAYLSASDDVRVDEAPRDARDPRSARHPAARRLRDHAILRGSTPTSCAAIPAIVGFSDATALLAWAHAAGVRGIHVDESVSSARCRTPTSRGLVTLLTDPSPPGVRPWSLTTPAAGSIAARSSPRT